MFVIRLYSDISKGKAALDSIEGLLIVCLTLCGIFAFSHVSRPFLTSMAEVEEFLEKGEDCINSLKFRSHSFSCPSLRARECFRAVSF